MKSGPSGYVPRRQNAWVFVLLVVPFVALLWVPFYASGSPEFMGIPYFFWYQFLWVPIAAILTAVVYRATGADEPTDSVHEVRSEDR